MRLLPIVALVALGLSACDRPVTTTTSSTPMRDTVVPDVKPVKPTESPDRDNTAVNTRDRASTTKTPIDQNENQKDIDTTAEIRKRVVDTELSVNAQNVKIITQDGKVTLRGPVKSPEEKKQVEDIAQAVAGEGNVDSQLEVEKNP